MYCILFVILAFVTAIARAELVCLGWGLISPVVGVICHFQPNAFHAAQNAAVTAVDEAVQSAEDLVHFDLTHNPASVTYNFLSHATSGGLAEGGQSWVNATVDFEGVGAGFVKETANQAVQIYSLAHWNDVSFCLIRGAAGLAQQAVQTAKRAGVPSEADAVRMAQGCISDKLKRIAKPALFNITEPNQKIGSSISDVAALLIPVGVEEEAGAQAIEGAVDLAIPGSEESTRVMKLTREDLNAEHFANEAEAQAVADSMKDEEWVKSNCRVCRPAPVLNVAIAKRRRRRSTGSRLRPRGNILTSCCRASATISEAPAALDSTLDEMESIDATSEPSDEIYDSEDYNTITEDSLVPAQPYEPRDISTTAGLVDLQSDLNTLSTGVVPWSPAMRASTAHLNIFHTLREVFEGPASNPMYSLLKISAREDKLRLDSLSQDWITHTHPSLRPLQNFVHRAMEQAIDTATKLKRQAHAAVTHEYKGGVNFIYTPPSRTALTGVDPRGFHVDVGILQFAASDTPGLIVRNAATGTASRVPVVGDAFYLMKAVGWDAEAFVEGGVNGATWHSVFGPEMAERGRVSMVLSIYQKT